MMKIEKIQIGNIPGLVYGAPGEKGYVFVHGQNGYKEEAEAFAKNAVPAGYQVLSIDLPEHGERKRGQAKFVPWIAVPELQTVIKHCQSRWKQTNLRANSIGAYFSMQAMAKEPLGKALFVSPIVDMERLILTMMRWANVTEAQLQEKGEISTDFGKTLSWQYLCWAREHALQNWQIPTAVLYAGQDTMTDTATIETFAKNHAAKLTVYEQGEHWFHTPEQLEVLKKWERETLL